MSDKLDKLGTVKRIPKPPPLPKRLICPGTVDDPRIHESIYLKREPGPTVAATPLTAEGAAATKEGNKTVMGKLRDMKKAAAAQQNRPQKKLTQRQKAKRRAEIEWWEQNKGMVHKKRREAPEGRIMAGWA